VRTMLPIASWIYVTIMGHSDQRNHWNAATKHYAYQ
jgi:hypothetical protein